MIEYKTERVSHAEEEAVIDINARFGWQLIDSQEVYSENTRITGVEAKSYGNGIIGGFMQGFTGRDGTVKVKQQTDVVSYVTLRFGRDTQMPHYGELKRLESGFECDMRIFSSAPNKPKLITTIMAVAMVIIIISIVLAIVEGTSAEIWEICVCVLVPLIFIPLTVLSWKRYKKKSKICDKAYARACETLEQASKLLDE